MDFECDRTCRLSWLISERTPERLGWLAGAEDSRCEGIETSLSCGLYKAIASDGLMPAINRCRPSPRHSEMTSRPARGPTVR
jgi:hypothetical protein